MSKGQLRIPDYLEHILEAIRRIRRYTKGMDEATFRVDERTQDAVIRNIEIIGEATSNISMRMSILSSSTPRCPGS